MRQITGNRAKIYTKIKIDYDFENFYYRFDFSDDLRNWKFYMANVSSSTELVIRDTRTARTLSGHVTIGSDLWIPARNLCGHETVSGDMDPEQTVRKA